MNKILDAHPSTLSLSVLWAGYGHCAVLCQTAPSWRKRRQLRRRRDELGREIRTRPLNNED